MTLYSIVYGPCPGKNADFLTLLDRALVANVVMARACLLAGDRVNEALHHREINKLLDLREQEGGVL
ncbi:hypothetical protein [Streptomyces lydicus]|uniref:hypothetical protein n=1 Tax=Streptomyces lydicus TaxID=47763 RepID=UPI0037898600